jgi:hypothetical protein
MKTKITFFLAFIGMIMLNSCTINEDNDQVDNDTISEVFELRNVDFTLDANGQYSIFRELNPQIFASDVILIYRMSGVVNSSTPIWQQIPRTLYLPEGELDYDFDFTRFDFTIYAGGTYNLASTPSYITNETFRIVIVPGFLSNKGGKSVDYSNYEEVIKAYNIDDSNVKVIQ